MRKKERVLLLLVIIDTWPYIGIVMTTGPLTQLFSALAKFDYVRAKSVVTKMESLGKVGKGFNFVKNARL